MKRKLLFTILLTFGVTLRFTLTVYFKSNKNNEILQLNWKISISDEHPEVFNTTDNHRFNGDGLRYTVCEYQSFHAVKPSFTWTKNKDSALE